MDTADARRLSDDLFEYAATLLPSDLGSSARQFGALGRCRSVPNALALVRMLLAYAVGGLSLKDVAAWATASGVAEITGPGLFYRVRIAGDWMEHLLAQVLQREVEAFPAGRSLRVVDATVLTGPGAVGTEWRAPVQISAASGRMRSVELTDERGGEGLARHRLGAGDIVLGDRAYATAVGIDAMHQSGADVIVRIDPHRIRLCDAEHRPVRVREYEGRVPRTGVVEWCFTLPIPPTQGGWTKKHCKLREAVRWIDVRVVASQTLKGEVKWILITLPQEAMDAVTVAAVYGLPWQIELFFKRMKSLAHLDDLPSQRGPTARTWILARFLAAALIEQMTAPGGAFPLGIPTIPGATAILAPGRTSEWACERCTWRSWAQERISSYVTLGSEAGSATRRAAASPRSSCYSGHDA